MYIVQPNSVGVAMVIKNLCVHMNRHGYFPLPTEDPAEKNLGRTEKSPRPGLFFMFGDRGKKYAVDPSDSEEIEMTELNRKRKKPKRRKLRSPKGGKSKSPLIYVEEPILPGDTLQRVALRYDCRVSSVLTVCSLCQFVHK